MHKDTAGSLVSPTALAVQRSLRRAMRKLELALRELAPDPIHDVRVALRRCRSLAEGFANLDPHPSWRKLLKACKKQQRGLADLRDIQVMRGWLKELGLASGPAGSALAAMLDEEESAARKRALASLDDFPRKRWKRWWKRLPVRAQLVPANEARWAEIALQRLGKVRVLDRRWHRTHTMKAWHRLRIAVKRFRYIMESFLPVQCHRWEKDLKRLQDLLGEGHDLDVLRAKLIAAAAERKLPKRSLEAALRPIDRALAERVEAYERAVVTGAPPAPAALGRQRRNRKRMPQTLWDLWHRELTAAAGTTSPGGAAAAPSSATPARPAEARNRRSPDTRRRTSSAR